MGLDIDAIHGAVVKGLPGDARRLHLSKVNLDYYRGDYEQYRYRIKDDPNSRCNRSSLLMKKIVDTLTSYLYRDNPVRVIPDQEQATDFLQKVYTQNSMFAKWQAADRLSVIGSGGAVAFQVAATDDENNPIKIHVWSEDSFAIFRDPDDPLKVVAVVTMDCVGNQDRWRLYTAETVRYYLRESNSMKEFVLDDEEDNTYGVLPFSFAHFESPVLDFWSGSPGNVLREMQDYIIFRLTSLADAIKYLALPKVVISGHDPTWKPPGEWSPSEWMTITAAPGGAGGPNGKVDINQIVAPLNFVDSIWEDIDKFNEHSMECAGVPLAAVRMVQSVARSGSSIAQEQAPLVNYSRGRQRAWHQYETDLARVVLQVAVAHLGDEVDYLRPALENFQLSVRWTSNFNSIPGPERDRADAFGIEHGFTSVLQVIQDREGCGREEAIAKLEAIARDREIESRLMPSVATNQSKDVLGGVVTTSEDVGLTPISEI
ncbi:phage portal protein [Tundrisphaera sp. TA3]|uniref:phage portal protein n=1 Tax=Tundrisphaera sp. TA3 TaxID=3435775 RepID=UPI003EBFAF17